MNEPRHKPAYKAHKILLLLLISIALVWLVPPAAAQTDEPVVHAVLFYSPSCPHCHTVIQEDLPPLMDRYGEQLEIAGVDTSTPGGRDLYLAAIDHFEIPQERRGVPALIIGDTVLVGSIEIPQQLPDLIEQHLVAGGLDWPDIPGFVAPAAATPTEAVPLSATLEAEAGETEPTAPASAATSASPTPAMSLPLEGGSDAGDPVPAGVLDKVGRDPVGNGLSIVLLLGMIASVGYVARLGTNNQHEVSSGSRATDLPDWRAWAVGALALVGLGVSIYMTYVETTQATAVCGPVGDCNTVQQSEYARLFGVLPIGVLGMLGYAAMLVAWAAAQFRQGNTARRALAALFGMALAGTLFSIYLTFLEPFVIGATCAWCLTSALAMTLILLLVAGPGVAATLQRSAGQQTQEHGTIADQSEPIR